MSKADRISRFGKKEVERGVERSIKRSKQTIVSDHILYSPLCQVMKSA